VCPFLIRIVAISALVLTLSGPVSKGRAWTHDSQVLFVCERSSPICGSNSNDPKRLRLDFDEFEAKWDLVFLARISRGEPFIQRRPSHVSGQVLCF
jgi:hypothetical protein